MYRWLRGVALAVLVSVLVVVLYLRAGGAARTGAVQLPPGFAITIYADGVEDARAMTVSERGIVYVGTRSAGNVYAVHDADGDLVGDEVLTVAQGLTMPNGVAWKDGDLYVAELDRVVRFDGIDERLHDPPDPVVVNATFPRETHHGWRYLRFGPDGRLYVSVGAPCNVCERRDDERFATILRMNPDGSGLEIVARGVRNSVGFDWHPATGELWFTDNGRDWLGNDEPPDELNRAPAAGLHFGFPFCHGGSIADPDLAGARRCDEFVSPVQPLGPHVAALGMRFYTGGMFPDEYVGQIFIAEHGSWNRLPPIGYRITRVRLAGNRAVAYEVFAEGWLRRGRAWGRPTDLVILPDGSMLVSDDRAGVIYRIAYRRE